MTAAYTLTAHLEHLKRLINKLERYKKNTTKANFLKNEITQDSICRALQQTLEAILTCADMLIAQRGLRKPSNYNELLQILAEARAYPLSFAAKLDKLGGFRNILVHDYMSLDYERVWKYIEQGLPLYKKYALYISRQIRQR